MIAPPRQKRQIRPLDAARLDELALAYVARFAVSAAKLETYLKRKLRQRGWAAEGEPDGAQAIDNVIGRFVRAGYVDDAGYARMKAGSLLRRGYGERRVAQALDAAGIAPEQRGAARATESEARAAGLAFARRRRIGPFGAEVDRAGREKQLAAMLRAGHRLALARAVLECMTIEAAEAWAAEPSAEENNA